MGGRRKRPDSNHWGIARPALRPAHVLRERLRRALPLLMLPSPDLLRKALLPVYPILRVETLSLPEPPACMPCALRPLTDTVFLPPRDGHTGATRRLLHSDKPLASDAPGSGTSATQPS